jgi:NAD(P)-dependent dehydrogenase (short-subunit alcohol dehydrogenase family)
MSAPRSPRQSPTHAPSVVGDPLAGRRIFVTGGTSGLGLALVRVAHARGARVGFVARTAAAVESVAEALPGSVGIVGDVAEKAAIHRIALQATGRLGGLDVLVNNASSLGPVPLASLADTECEALEEALTTNLVGPFRLTRALLGALAASAREGTGSVVLNVSSDAAVQPYPGWGAYGASKAGLRHLSQIWDQELQELGIRVLSVDPGDMDTPLHALALPDADRGTLRDPAVAAAEVLGAIVSALAEGGTPRAMAPSLSSG